MKPYFRMPRAFRAFFLLPTALLFFPGADDAYAKQPVVYNLTYKAILVGDDLYAGKGLLLREGGKEKAAEYLSAHFRKKIILMNASTEGLTTSGALPFALHAQAKTPDMLILAVGVNDALQRTDPDIVYSNLDTILKELSRAGAYVLLVMPDVPPGIPSEYAQKFNLVFPALARRHNAYLLRGMMDGIYGDPRLTAEDRLLPNQQGLALMAERLSVPLEEMAQRIMFDRQCRRYNKNGNPECSPFRQKKESGDVGAG